MSRPATATASARSGRNEGRAPSRSTRRTQENVVALALLGVFCGVVYLCQDFGPRARMIPMPLAIFGIVLTLIQLVWQNVRSTDELKMDLISVADRVAVATPGKDDEGAERAPAKTGAEWSSELRAFGIVAFLIALFLAIGIIPAVFVFTAVYFVLTRQYSWLAGLMYTTAFTLCVYVLFFMALQIQPYHGLLTPLMERLQ